MKHRRRRKRALGKWQFIATPFVAVVDTFTRVSPAFIVIKSLDHGSRKDYPHSVSKAVSEN